MDFVHFLKSQRYRTRVPLRQLQFTVQVYRAMIVEEANAELLAEVTVPWDGKVLSPQESLNLYRDLSALLPAPVTAPEGGEPKQQPQHATSAGGVAEAAAQLGLHPSPPPPSGFSALPSPAELVAHLRQPQSHFFTRPTLEDFIDEAEEDFPVDPPQGPSRLAPVILRQHRRDHQPNRKMFLMWAAGDVVGGGSGASTAPALPAALRDGTGNVEDVFSPPSAAAAAVDLGAVRWEGSERVLCTLTAEADEHVFTARPSLGPVHTLYVDAAHIYTFRVSVSKAERKDAGAGQWADTAIVSDGSQTPSAPLDAVLANVRELAQYAETQYEALELGKDAVARRLLRQAALMVPPERGSSATHTVATAAAHATGAAADDVTRRRRSPLGLSVVAGGGLERSNTAFGGAAAAAALLARSTVMRGGSRGLPRGQCQYYVFGTVDRCVGIAESTLFLRCQLVEDSAASAWVFDPLTTASPSAACEFSSQLAHVGTFLENETMLNIDHVFNLPFEYSFVDAATASGPLRLILSAFTEGAAAEGLQSAVAYACVSLPTASPGRHTVTASLWAPHKSGVEFLRSTLLGGAPSLVDARQSGPPPTHRTGVSVKEGLYADSVGYVQLTVNVLHHRSTEGR